MYVHYKKFDWISTNCSEMSENDLKHPETSVMCSKVLNVEHDSMRTTACLLYSYQSSRQYVSKFAPDGVAACLLTGVGCCNK